MLIRSDFKDFYDYASAYGVDTSIVYQRTNDRKTFKGRIYPKRDRVDIGNKSTLWKHPDYGNTFMYYHVVVVCGKPIVIMTGDTYSKNIPRWRLNSEYRRITSLDPIFQEGTIENIVFPDKKPPTHEELQTLFPLDAVDWAEWCDRYQSPIVILSTNENQWSEESEVGVEVSPCLREYGLHTILDPTQVHQDISMWMTRVVDPEPLSMTEKDQVNRHGFHDTHAFRKTKGSK